MKKWKAATECYMSIEHIHTCSVYHNLFNYRPFARLNMYHLMFSSSFFAPIFRFIFICSFARLSARWLVQFILSCCSCLFNVFHRNRRRLLLLPFLPISLILLLISWVQIDSKRQQPNRNRCCLNNSMRYTHAFMYTTFALCLSWPLRRAKFGAVVVVVVRKQHVPKIAR